MGEEIVLLDADFSDSELLMLTGHNDVSVFTRQIPVKGSILPETKEALITRLRTPASEWKVKLYTSGTTGKPKEVSHNFESIARNVKISPRHSRSIWGFAYNPTHMAGLQVFLQAALNGNSIVRLFGMDPGTIFNEIKENGITHISATPTFYRLLLPCNTAYDSVKRITFGGERLDRKIVEQLKNIFPNAKITNVYASTEAGTLFASEGDVFSVTAENKHLIRIRNDELLIHKSLLGSAELNTDEWFSTGDMVETLNSDPLQFRFVSRIGDFINVGGYKVNPAEVEEAVMQFPNVLNARVYSRKSSVLGNIVCCEVVRLDENVTEYSLRNYLHEYLQEHKIPRLFRFVDELSTTRTGKIKRDST